MVKNSKNTERLVEQIDKCLPQIHCQKCGFVSCLPYAKAIEKEKTSIYKCEPGGAGVVAKIAKITGKTIDNSKIKEKPPEVVYIDPETCIGCALCIPKCPVDAIAGAEGYLHTIIINECTGCDLCIDSCPVDCIRGKKRLDNNLWTGLKAEKSRNKFYDKNRINRKPQHDSQQEQLESVRELLFSKKKNSN